jgi:H+/Cl- antiporter ClcA
VFTIGYIGSVVAVSKSFITQMVVIFELDVDFDFIIGLIGMVKPKLKLRGS